MLSGKHSREKQRVIADVLAHLALAIERRRWTVDGIGLKQHLANVVERALVGVANLEHLFDFAELRQHVDDVVLHLGVAQTDVAVEVMVNQFTEQAVQRMRFRNHVLVRPPLVRGVADRIRAVIVMR